MWRWIGRLAGLMGGVGVSCAPGWACAMPRTVQVAAAWGGGGWPTVSATFQQQPCAHGDRPPVCCVLCLLPAVYKRVPASQHLSDAELLDQLFKTSSKGGKAHAEK